MALSRSFALPVLRTVTMRGSCRALTRPCLIGVSPARRSAGGSVAKVCPHLFHAGFGGGGGVDVLEGRSRMVAHILVLIG